MAELTAAWMAGVSHEWRPENFSGFKSVRVGPWRRESWGDSVTVVIGNDNEINLDLTGELNRMIFSGTHETWFPMQL